MSESPRRPHLALVVGAGRSGTSLTAGVFGQLGFHVPQPEVPANFTNPRGFGESRWVVDFHADLMRQQHIALFDARPDAWADAALVSVSPGVAERLRAWLSEEFNRHDRVIVKDPRTVWFIPLWRRCAADLGVSIHYVTALRHPAEVLRSIRTTAGKGQTEASRAAWWAATTLNAEHSTRDSPRAFVLYDSLLGDWRSQMERVERAAELPLLSSADAASVAAVDRLIDPSLRRSEPGWADVDVPESVKHLADAVWRRVSALARDDADGPAPEDFDALRAAYERLYREAESIADSTVLHAIDVRPHGPAAARPAPSLARRAVRRLPAPLLDRVRRVRRRIGRQRR